MQRYLAEKYMSGPKADAILAKDHPKSKKRKIQQKNTHSSGIGIVDEDIGWGKLPQEDETEENVVVASDRTFKKRKTGEGDGGWVPVNEPLLEEDAEDEKPVVVESTASNLSGGLHSHAEIKQRLATQQSSKQQRSQQPTAEEQETIYRDASGHKRDTKAERAEAARLKREQEEMEAKRMEWGKGVVQREAEVENKREAELERHRDFARGADDDRLNATQREQMRWNDPAAAFLTKTRSKGPKKPEYSGPPPPPNRFGIKPGYRWDGVDRSNGFEKKLFQRQNERQRRGAEAYQWSVDEM